MKSRKKGILGAVFFLVCVFSFSLGMKVTEEKAGATAVGTIKVPGLLNVRTGPGAGFALVKSGGTSVTLTDGVKVTITGKNGKWYHVKFQQNGKTVIGYVSAAYVQVKTGSVCTKVYGTVSAKSIKVRGTASADAAVVKAGKTAIQLKKAKKVRILSESVVKSEKWYKVSFRYSSKTYKGFLLSKDVTPLYEKGIPGIVKSSKTLSVAKKPGKTAALTVKGKKVSVKNAKELIILAQKAVSGKKYLYVHIAYNGSSGKGYLADEAVRMQIVKDEAPVATPTVTATLAPTVTATPTVTVTLAPTVTATPTVMATLAPTVTPKATAIPKPTVTSKITATPKPTETSKVTVMPTATATVTATATAVPKPTAAVTPTVTVTPKPTVAATPEALTDAEYKEKLQEDGFPKSYISGLLALHKLYPNWTFQPFKTGLKWNTVIKKESAVGLNLLSINKASAWKSTEKGAYNWQTGKYIPYDGSTWVTASKQAVEYYMDPRNFLDERGIFQFESLEYQKDAHTQDGVEKILKNTPMANKNFSYQNTDGTTAKMKYSKAFMKAAEKSGVSPYHLASRVKQEVVVSATTMSSSVSGKVPGYEGIYNFYNIGAAHSTVAGGAVANGLKWASTGTTYSRPWTSPKKSIIGGATFIGKSYINVGQNTLYLQKFNVTSKNRYSHQYMANIEAPNSEATKINTAYGTQKAEMPIVFSVPVYEDMPDAACRVPSGDGNPNNYLKSLSVSGQTLSPKFTAGDDGSKVYTLTVGKNVSSAKITASAAASSAKVTGTGKKTLSAGTKTYTVKVTAESGGIRKYKIKITKPNT